MMIGVPSEQVCATVDVGERATRAAFGRADTASSACSMKMIEAMIVAHLESSVFIRQT